MIEFKLPRLNGTSCNICHRVNDVVEITFRSDCNNSGHTVAICCDCRKTLVQLLKGCGGADGGETVCGSTELVVHCRECKHWDLETEHPSTIPRQCECKMFTNSSVSCYTQENGYCHMGEKRDAITIRDWLRSLPDEQLVKFLDWSFMCPDPENCTKEDACIPCAIKRLKQEYAGEGDGWGE